MNIKQLFDRIKLFWRLASESIKADNLRQYNFMSETQWEYRTLWENYFNTKTDSELIELYKQMMYSDNATEIIHKEIGIQDPSFKMVMWFLDYMKYELINRLVQTHERVQAFDLGDLNVKKMHGMDYIERIKNGYISGNGTLGQVLESVLELEEVASNNNFPSTKDELIKNAKVKFFWRLNILKIHANDLKKVNKDD